MAGCLQESAGRLQSPLSHWHWDYACSLCSRLPATLSGHRPRTPPRTASGRCEHRRCRALSASRSRPGDRPGPSAPRQGRAHRSAVVRPGAERAWPDRTARAGVCRPPGQRCRGTRHPGDHDGGEHALLGLLGPGLAAGQMHPRQPQQGQRMASEPSRPTTQPSSPTWPSATGRAWPRSRSGTSPTRPTKPTSPDRTSPSVTPPSCAPPTPRSSRRTRMSL